MKYLGLGLLIILFLLMARLLSSDGGIGELFLLETKLSQLEQTIEKQEQKNRLLQEEVSDLQTSTRAVESIARQKLGMVKSDETFVEVIEVPEQAD